MTHVLTEGDILFKPFDTPVFYKDRLSAPFIKVHKIMPQMVDILPLASVVTPVEDSEFWHSITAGDPYPQPQLPPASPQQKSAATNYSFSGSTTTKSKKVVASTAAAHAIARSQLHRIAREDFGRKNYQGFIPWSNESLHVALYKPKLKVGYQGDSIVDVSASISPGSVVKIPSGIRLAAGEAEFNMFCLETFDYLPQELSVVWAGQAGFPRVQHEYLIFQEEYHLAMLVLRWPNLLWR